jgi:hypothetical protein
MTLEDQFKAARDISPRFGFMSVVRDGKTVNIPLLEGRAGALLVSDDQGTYIDPDGGEWLIGTQNGELVKRRLA